jgi:hypothetical protein
MSPWIWVFTIFSFGGFKAAVAFCLGRLAGRKFFALQGHKAGVGTGAYKVPGMQLGTVCGPGHMGGWHAALRGKSAHGAAFYRSGMKRLPAWAVSLLAVRNYRMHGHRKPLQYAG